MGVPLPCQKQLTMKDNRDHSGDIHTAPELSTRSSRARGRQPDKHEVGGSSPPRPTTQTPSSDARRTHLAVPSGLNLATLCHYQDRLAAGVDGQQQVLGLAPGHQRRSRTTFPADQNPELLRRVARPVLAAYQPDDPP